MVAVQLIVDGLNATFWLTVKVRGVLVPPTVFTTRLPVAAPAGTDVTIRVFVQSLGLAITAATEPPLPLANRKLMTTVASAGISSAVEVTIHCRERPFSRGNAFGETIRELLRAAGVREPEACNRDRRLVVVLLEEHPLQYLCALVRVVGNKARAIAEIPDDRARFRERPAVIEYERRNS